MCENYSMKICFVLNTHWSSGMGGAEYQALLLMKELNKDNEVFYICRYANEISDHIITVKSNNKFNKYAFFFDAINLYKTLKKINPRVVYHRDAGAYTGVCAFYCKKFGKKFLWNLARDNEVDLIEVIDLYNPFKFIDKLLLRYGIKNHKIIIAQTLEQQELLNTNYGITDSSLIPNFHPIPKLHKKNNIVKKVIWVSNLKNIKRPEMFFELVKNFKNNKQVRFYMIGLPNFKYEKTINRLSSEANNFEYLGKLSQLEVNDYIENSDLFVNTSILEGFPNTFIQSWMRGVPVMSMCIDPSKIIRKNNIGVIAPDVETMIKVVNELILNSREFDIMGKNAIIYAKKNHSLKNISKIKALMELKSDLF